MPAPASKIDVLESPIKSVETTSSSVYPKIPLRSFSEAFFIAKHISSYLVDEFRFTVRSTTETSIVGTLNAIPVSLPSSSGIILPNAFAAPVEEGIILANAALPPLQSFVDGPSTIF